MLYFQRDFGEVTIDGIQNVGDISSGITETDRRKIHVVFLSQLSKRTHHPASISWLQMSSWKIQPLSKLIFEVGDKDFHEIFIVIPEKSHNRTFILSTE